MNDSDLILLWIGLCFTAGMVIFNLAVNAFNFVRFLSWLMG